MLGRGKTTEDSGEVVWQIACSVYVILLTFKLLIAFKFFMRCEVNRHIFVPKAALRYSGHVLASLFILTLKCWM